MELYERKPSMKEHQPDFSIDLEESMWKLELGDDEDLPIYPERPGKPNCTYYIRTGSCGYGNNCRFNHPRDRWMVTNTNESDGIVKYSENVGQPICQTGTCKYGTLCKYDHSRQGDGLVLPITLNIHGYPFRPGEKECSYYMRTGLCKFGTTCKFHHPENSDISMPSLAPTFYSMVQSPVVPTLYQYPITRSTVLPAPSMLGPYNPMLFPSEIVPIPRWSSCQGDSVCAYYAQFGVCKYGSACKYEHPVGVLNYIPSTSSLVNMPVVPHPATFPIPTLAPSSSFSELQPEFTPNEYSVAIGMPSSGSMLSSSADPMVSGGGLVPQSIPQSSDQTYTPARSSAVGQSGDVSSSN